MTFMGLLQEAVAFSSDFGDTTDGWGFQWVCLRAEKQKN